MAVEYCSYNHNEHKVEEQNKVEEEEEEEEYIDMEVGLLSCSNNNTRSYNPPAQHPREFEFQMCSTINVERDTTTSPADELFYMGKLLPLHLPPRLRMVEKLVQDSTPNKLSNAEFYSTPLASTPFESCNISPAESCQVSRELDPQEYCCVYANQDYQKGFIGDNHHAKRSWTKKLKTKIKSLFGKSDEQSSPSSAVKNKLDQGLNSEENNEDRLEKKIKKIPQVISREKFERQNDVNEAKICHRRSFSAAFKRRSSTATTLTPSSSSVSSSSCSSSSSSSSSTSSNSNGPLLKRSSSANSEMETSLIQGAIAHCKQSSQQTIQARKILCQVGSQSLPSSGFAASLDDL